MSEPTPIINRDEATETVKHLAHLTALLGATVALKNSDVLKAQEKYQVTITQLVNEIEIGKAKLEEWAQANREEFGESKTLEFPNGWLRFRMGQRKLLLLSRWDDEKVLEKLESFPVTSQWHEFIRQKNEINKRKLLDETKPGGSLPEKKLREIGLRVDREETFEVEVKPETGVEDVPCP